MTKFHVDYVINVLFKVMCQPKQALMNYILIKLLHKIGMT